MAERALLLLPDEHALAMPPTGEGLVVFDPENGDGAECCCGGGVDPCKLCEPGLTADCKGTPFLRTKGQCIAGGPCTMYTRTGSGVNLLEYRFDFSLSREWLDTGYIQPGTKRVIRTASGSVSVRLSSDGCFQLWYDATGTVKWEEFINGALTFRRVWSMGEFILSFDTNPLGLQGSNSDPSDPDCKPINQQYGDGWTMAKFGAYFLGGYQSDGMQDSVYNFTTGARTYELPCNMSVRTDFGENFTRKYSCTCGGGSFESTYRWNTGYSIVAGSANGSCTITPITYCPGSEPERTCEEWIELWLAGSPEADINRDGFVDGIDFDEITRRYCAGVGG